MFQYNAQSHHIGRPLIQSIFPEIRTEATPSRGTGKPECDLEQRLTKLENILNKDVIEKLQLFEERLHQMSTSQSKVQNTTIQSTDSLISQLQQEQSALIQKVSQLEDFIADILKVSPNTSSPMNANHRSMILTNQQKRMSQPSFCQDRITQRAIEAAEEKRNNSVKAQIRNSSNDQKQAEFAMELQSLRYQIQDCLTLTQIPHQNERINTTINVESQRQCKSFGPEVNSRQSLGNLLSAQSKQDNLFQTQRGQLKKVASNSSIQKPISTSSAQATKSQVLTSGISKARDQHFCASKTDITPVTQLKHSFVQNTSLKQSQKQIFKGQNILSEVSPIAKLRNEFTSGFSFTNDITIGVNTQEYVPLEKIIDGLDSQEVQEEQAIKR